ncbi:MAG: EscV/YscV/HrcV family type III secretion system export apparatus protein [Planctomycetia bacterium]|nr:EscV/YscV/HrcV family type III secretion system export apparatus protein [Planctomycetia bacterium]
MSHSLGTSFGTTPSATSSTGMPAAVPGGAAVHVLDYVVPGVILAAVAVVFAPVPPAVVDLLLAANLTVSVLALLGALAARTPLEMAIFPTFLLGSTLVRLVLNIATTRLILTRAAVDGAGAAGQVVQAFGEFVAANDLVVGGVIFAIIAVIQFVVITAGSTRTSEVAARFALDGLPGRQMAIDADLQAGVIGREQARLLRTELQRQADFFASMDGASRFVRGEAVAGVVITLVNLLGGLAIGVLEHSLPLPRALEVYSRLTIGDGLVSAVPALLVSVATGLLISRSSQTVDLSRELGRQFASRPHVLLVSSVFLALLSLTDLPFLPLAVMAAVMAGAAVVVARRGRLAAAAGPAGAGAAPTLGGGQREASGLAATVLGEHMPPDDATGNAIAVDLGRGLASLLAGAAPLVTLTGRLRTAIAADIGIVLPRVSFRDDPALPDRGYRVTIGGELFCEEEIPAGRLLAISRPGESPGVDGEEGTDPLDGRRALWIAHARSETARRRGATVLDEAACVARALEAAVRRRADELLPRDAVARLVESLRASQPALVEQVIPRTLTIAKLHRTLQCLLREGVPIRPLSELLEVMADHAAEAQEPWQLAERVRRALARTICRRARDRQGRLAVVRLSPAAIEECSDPSVVAPPSARLVADLRRALRPVVERGAAPVLLVPGAVRRNVRDSLARQLPDLRVLAEEEVAGEGRVDVFATVGGDGSSRAA